MAQTPAEELATPEGKRTLEALNMALTEPHIALTALETFKRRRWSSVPYDDPAFFNATVERFLSTPFRKKDRIQDLMTSPQKSIAEAEAARQDP